MNYKDIQKQFNKVIAYSQGIENPNTDDIFSRWLEGKRDFIEAMNGELIYQYPEKVSFELDKKEKNLRVDDFIEMISSRWRNDDLADFVMMEREGFFSNQVVVTYNYHGVMIPKGMKLLKAFKFFEKDKLALNDIQSAASMIIQEDKIEGFLCFSVHPLDYLSLAENNHNWHSCHSLDGDYRSGNLSYLVDKSTVICYLKSVRDEVLPNFPSDVLWNSKKWRVLLFFDEDWKMMFAGRQYPFFSDSGINLIKDKILPTLHMGQWSDWLKKKIRNINENGYNILLHSPYIPINHSLVPLNSVVVNEKGSLQFNDLLYSSCYDPLYAFKIDNSFQFSSTKLVTNNFVPIDSNNIKIRVGGQIKCLCCGEEPIELSETMMCTDCELEYGNSNSDVFGTCPCCGRRFVFDDGFWVNETDEVVCPSCAEEYTDCCCNCEDRYYKDSMVYDRQSGEWFCKYCYEDVVQEDL